MIQNDIRFLGTSGGKDIDNGSSCLQVADNIVIDAGNIMNGLGEMAQYIEYIFLTHSHLDHISDIAFLIDTYFTKMQKPLKIFALQETLDALDKYIFNWSIWPDFKEIDLLDSSKKSIEFIALEIGKEYIFENVSLKPIILNHTVATCGYVIKKRDFSAVYATDTYLCDNLWQEVNKNLEIDSVIIDVSFPSHMDMLAKSSKHLTPKLLQQELKKLKRDDVSIYAMHIKPSFYKEVVAELNIYGSLKNSGRVIRDGEYLKNRVNSSTPTERLMKVSTALSTEKDLSKILKMILLEVMEYTNAEGGTIYLKENNVLTFNSVVNFKLNISEFDKKLPTISLYNNGKKNHENISALCAFSKKIINIPDVYIYNHHGVSFEGAKKFDKLNNYRSKSMLVVPMMNQDGAVVGVLQLINKRGIKDKIISFTQSDIDMTSTYSNWAASAITKNRLIEDMESMLISFLESISYAMSKKSEYGYSHISRVAELMSLVSKEIDKDQTIYKDISYTAEELKELDLAAWMHDIGKISTPEYILDKATRLETIFDRIELINERFERVKALLRGEMLELKCAILEGKSSTNIFEMEEFYLQKIEELEKDRVFLNRVNRASFFVTDKDIIRIKNIAKKNFVINGESMMMLSENEVENLSIIRGTLTTKEREKINEHALVTYEMLNMITFPKKFQKVKEIASGHHEKLNAKGYPFGLGANDISFETRILAIVDIMEALTASDRPYKRAKTPEEAFKILSAMVKNGELDSGIVDFIKDKQILENYLNMEVTTH